MFEPGKFYKCKTQVWCVDQEDQGYSFTPRGPMFCIHSILLMGRGEEITYICKFLIEERVFMLEIEGTEIASWEECTEPNV